MLNMGKHDESDCSHMLALDIQSHLVEIMTEPPKICPKHQTSGGMTGCLGRRVEMSMDPPDFVDVE